MTIDDLKRGYLVEFRDEGYGIIGSSTGEKIIIYRDYSYDSIDDWNEDLTDKSVCSFDIIKVYKPKEKASLMLSLDDYELIWEKDSSNMLAIEACKKIEEKYYCAAEFEAGSNSYYKFTFDFLGFTFSILVCMDNILTTYELLDMLYRYIDDFILSSFKR